MFDWITNTALMVAVLAVAVSWLVLRGQCGGGGAGDSGGSAGANTISSDAAMNILTHQISPGGTAMIYSDSPRDTVMVRRVDPMFNAAGEYQIVTNAGPVQQIRSADSLCASLTPYFSRGARLQTVTGEYVVASNALPSPTNASTIPCGSIGAYGRK